MNCKIYVFFFAYFRSNFVSKNTVTDVLTISVSTPAKVSLCTIIVVVPDAFSPPITMNSSKLILRISTTM